MKWQDKAPTEKQLAYIAELQEFSTFRLPKFQGKTRGEASAYIDAYTKFAHESTWGDEHGY